MGMGMGKDGWGSNDLNLSKGVGGGEGVLQTT